MYSCKLGSLALLLALYASHDFMLLHCQEPGYDAPEPTDLNYGSPSPPPLPPPTTWVPTLDHDLPTTESAHAQVPIGVIAGPVIVLVVVLVGLLAALFIWRKVRTRQSAQPPKGKPPFAFLSFKDFAYIGGFGASRIYFTKRKKDQK